MRSPFKLLSNPQNWRASPLIEWLIDNYVVAGNYGNNSDMKFCSDEHESLQQFHQTMESNKLQVNIKFVFAVIISALNEEFMEPNF